MFGFGKKKEKGGNIEYIRFNTKTCEKYVFSNAPKYTANYAVGLFKQVYELFKADGKFFLVVKNDNVDSVFEINEKYYKQPIECIEEIRHILMSYVGVSKVKAESVIQAFMEQGLVQTTHFY